MAFVVVVDVDVSHKQNKTINTEVFFRCLLVVTFFFFFTLLLFSARVCVCVCVCMCKSSWPSALLEVDVRGLLCFHSCEFYAQVDCEVF